jgi:type II secretory pathway component PulF
MADERKLTESEAGELSERIAAMARSGLPLGPGLFAIAEEIPAGTLQDVMRRIAEAIDSGSTLEEAIQAKGGPLPPQLRGLILAGLRTGRVGDLMGRFSIYSSTGNELRRRLRLGLAYPIISSMITLVLFSFACLVLVPQFEVIFRDFSLPIPKLTAVLFEISHVFLWAWPGLVAVLVLCFVVWVLDLLLNRSIRSSLVGRIPLVGGVWRWTSLAEFFHLLALLLEGEVPMPEALRLAGDGVGDRSLKRAGEHVARSVESGRSLADSMESDRRFPRGFILLLRWAEKPGSLPDVLHMIGQMFEVRAEERLTFAAILTSTISVTLIVCGAFLVILGLMLPLVTLISKLSG